MTAPAPRAPLPTDVSIITTYRCCMKCKMCNIWRYPTEIAQEIRAEELEILPQLKFVNITGGEPFVRRDLDEIVEVSFRKAPRVVISTSGYQVDEILALAEKFPRIGIRVSIEGLSTINDYLRGRDSGFDRGLKTLLGLRRLGIKDIGFGITVSNNNSADMLELYELSKNLKMEFATAAYHNSYYFHKDDNVITNQDEVCNNFYELIDRLLEERNPKSWFRAFFNLGLINYIKGNRRLLPCEAGTVNFFIEPYGDVYPCNGLEERYWKESFGNIRQVKSFEDIWYGPQADKVRSLVRTCPKNCWMVGTAAPVMKKYLRHPATWVLKNKLRSMAGRKIERGKLPLPFDVGQDPRQGDLREPEHTGEVETFDNYSESADTDRRHTVTVVAVEPLAGEAFLLRTTRGGYDFIPGQNVSIALHLDYARSKDFSICSGQADDFLEFMIKGNRAGTITPLLRTLEPGAKLDLTGPYGEFFYRADEKCRHVFLATGIGIGPFRSFLRSFTIPDYLVVHGVRRKADLALAAGIDPTRLVTCVSREDGGTLRGRITDYLRNTELGVRDFYYLSGNPFAVKDVFDILSQRGVPRERIVREFYYTY
ncbi:MAG: radical SAM protein [Kiritimatiellae bacterium]|jgi:radical SAM protein with 4Fe4S-binding SPASM domain|nr:radical SAM protein [Kiritimatiellia bacterium]OQC60711.1 MAG: Methane monooxygenase component C [Verrucomicrobia bacterium ADurb.Bin018]